VAKDQRPEHWAGIKEVGSLLGFRFLLFVYRVFGRFIFTVFLSPALLYFLIFHSARTRASLEYLTRVYRCGGGEFNKAPGYFNVFIHYFKFGHSVLDKLLAWSIDLQEDDFIVETRQEVDELCSDTRGQLIIGSHFGNLEYCRGFMLRYKEKPINVLLYDQHAANFVEMMRKINPSSRVNVYQVTELGLPTILALKDKVAAGEWLFIAGDRIPINSEQRTVEVDFLGEPAHLPIGPYMLAKTLDCPVKLMFSFKQGEKVIFEVVPFSEKVEIPRKTREASILKYAERFAKELEKRCLREPYQWFNFYDFWAKSTPLNKENTDK